MISGGGTGGHIYPAISIAQALKELLDEVEILFVGAEGRMEMKKVPEAGFEIVGLRIAGIQRSLSLKNLSFPFKLIGSLIKAFRLIKEFQPDAVVGVGGYASGPLLYAATRKGLATLIQEQNSYAGLTNKLLAKNVDRICVAHEGMEKYFPLEKIKVFGNPVREGLVLKAEEKNEAYSFFGLDPKKKTLLIIGGSLGARSINEFILAGYTRLAEQADLQVIWQTGGFYYEEMLERVSEKSDSILMLDFLKEMDKAYAVADVVVSRAGALSIAELMLTGKPAILVPSPNVAEDHQTVNARALVERDAAIHIKDSDGDRLIDEALSLLENDAKRADLSKNIKAMAHPNAAKEIANEIIRMIA